jgi:intein/homing endonuclease
MNYDEIKHLARETEQRVTDLIALAPQNDPFYTGTPGDWALAEWFARLWQVFNYQTKVHIRRVHYQIISQDPPVLLPNGKPYENTEECWSVLNLASKAARYLRLVDPGAFNDRRNPDPVVYASSRSHAPEVYVSGRLYASDVQLPDFPDLPGYQVSGYHAQQPYHLEVWCFPPETLVQTINGPLPMSALQVGDLVLTHKGRYRPVTRTFVRQYTGDLVRVRTRYSARDVRMTPNHQVLILQGKTSHGGRTARQLAWVAARDLVAANTARHYKGDYLAFPRVQEAASPLPMIEPTSGAGGRRDGRGGVLPREIEALPIDTDVAWLLGFFVGDGFVDHRSIQFTLHAREQDFAARLIQIGSRFGIRPTMSQYGNTVRVRYNALRLVSWFRGQFGGQSDGRSHTGSHNKRIPSWLITAPQDITAAFLRGYWDADGTMHSPGHQSLVTSSVHVAEGMRLMLARLGYAPTMLITRAGHYLIRWGGSYHFGKLHDEYLLLPIRDLSTEYYQGPVYNIEVAEDNSYVTEFVVHNCEKSTMNDVLEPLCKHYEANLQTGLGELSITATLALVSRLERMGKPARIFYVSDFDPAGQSMPVAVSRKIEYFVRTLVLEVDVRVFPVVLTLDQVQYYRLPRTPIKETERRRGGFEGRYGEGAVELDALEALYPGQLQAILSQYIECYYDTTLEERTQQVRAVLEGDLGLVWQQVIDRYADDITALRSAYEHLQAEFSGRMVDYSEQMQRLWQAIREELSLSVPHLDAYALPQPVEASEIGDGLYNSERDYLEQIEAYKEFQGKAS